MKQRMQVQGTITSWGSVAMNNGVAIKPGMQTYGYYTGMFHAGCSIWKTQGLKGLYAGYTLETLNYFYDVILCYLIPYHLSPVSQLIVFGNSTPDNIKYSWHQ